MGVSPIVTTAPSRAALIAVSRRGSQQPGAGDQWIGREGPDDVPEAFAHDVGAQADRASRGTRPDGSMSGG